MKQLWRTKPIAEVVDQQAGGLHRALGGLDLVFLGIGAVIGAGIFVLTGVAAATRAGPAISLSFVVAGLACLFAALVYAEFAAMVPVAGSAYTYSFVTMGEFMAWIIGWDLILEYSVASAAVAIGWSGYLLRMLASLGLELPHAFAAPPFAGGIMNLPAALIILLISGILALGVRHSSRFNTVIVVLKLGVIGLFIVVGLRHVEPANWQPFMPFGWNGVIAGAGLLFFAYIGFDAVSTAAEEARNPQRDLPIGIIGSLVLCTLLYVVVAAVLTGMVPFSILNVPDPVAFALLSVGERWAAGMVSIGAIAGLTSVLLVLMFGQSRIFFSMSRDGLLPAAFSHVHPRFRTPARTILATGLVVAALAGFLPIGQVAELVNIGTLAAFIFVAIGVLLLRWRRPDLPRPFRAPLVPLTSLLAILSCGYIIAHLDAITLWRFAVWMALGIIIYFAYAQRHSRLAVATATEQ